MQICFCSRLQISSLPINSKKEEGHYVSLSTEFNTMWYRILVTLSVIVLVIVALFWMATEQLKPTYQGELSLEGLNGPVEVIYDGHGVPHIYAESETDAHRALGYVHAQDRLFQMEMLRRLSSGRLAEVLGPELVASDTYFRTLGFSRHSEKSIAEFWTGDDLEPWQENTLAYLEGVNSFIAHGPKPLEFILGGIPKSPFTLEDVYLVDLFMAFGFAEGLREDPLITYLEGKLGDKYLKDLLLDWGANKSKIPVWDEKLMLGMTSISSHTRDIFSQMPVAPWHGSNGWVIGPGKSAGGKVLFANDTHMGYSQPSVWYEAHLEAPGYSMYGNYAAGRPFPVLGHNRFMALGLTMFENDDTDFFVLKPVDGKEHMYWWDGEPVEYSLRNEVISVKDGEDIVLQVRESIHGPVINEIIPGMAMLDTDPVAVAWGALQFPNENLQATYAIAKGQSMLAVKEAVSKINAPGLNAMYGDVDGNIAWWTTARLWMRPEGQSGKVFLDGSTSATLPLGILPWEQNPHAENPPSGFVYSANNQPESFDNQEYPGYYVPENRARRIMKLLEEEDQWTVEKVKIMINDVQADTDLEILHDILPSLSPKDSLQGAALQALADWDGAYTLQNVAGSIYNVLIYQIQQAALQDEMGAEAFDLYMGSHLQKRSLADLVDSDSSLWWDDVQTPVIESRAVIFQGAFEKAITILSNEHGANLNNWQWGRLHTIEHPHPFAQIEALRSMVNVGPLSIPGGNEVINNTGFKPDSTATFKVLFGPAMRRVLDMGDIARSWSVLPTGQSGHLLSPFYQDQAERYAEGGFRAQWLDREDIEREARYRLNFKQD
jgi:penicillin amidase